MTFPVTSTEWNPGAAPGISAGELNRIEQALLDAHTMEVDGSVEVDGPTAISSSSFADVASVNLAIPAEWNSWKCEAWASYSVDNASGSTTYETRIRIDGTDQQAKRGIFTAANQHDGAVGGRRTGMVTTGSRSVSLRARNAGAVSFEIYDIYLYARAVRTS